jgi:hypothetical protein
MAEARERYSVSMPVGIRQRVAADAQRHDDLFQRRIAGPLAEPLIVHSTWRAPALATAQMELATARPRSLWQCAEKITTFVGVPGDPLDQACGTARHIRPGGE